MCGKPAPAYFAAALELLGVAPARAAMVGDDIVNDVVGAQDGRSDRRAGADRASSSRPTSGRGTPDVVIDSLADVPAMLGIGG